MLLVLRHYRIILLNLLVAGIYLLLAKSGMLFDHQHGPVILWWPSGGFALAVLLLYGPHYIPGIFLGAFVASRDFDGPLLASFAVAFGNTGEVILGRYLLITKMKLDVSLNRLKDFLLIVLASPFIASVGALVGPTGMMLAGSLARESWGHAIRHWWLADLLGIVLVVTLILIWRQNPWDWCRRKGLFEIGILFALTYFAGQIIFLDWYQDFTDHYPKAFMMFLLLVIAAIRLGRHGVLIVLLTTAVQALWGASRGIGYFGNDLVNTHLADFSIYMLILSVVGMMLSTHIKEKNHAVRALLDSQNQFRTLANNSSVLVWMAGRDGLCTYFNKVWIDFTGRTLEQETGSGWTEGVHPDDLQHCLDHYMTAFAARDEFNLEYRLRRHDGVYRWVIDHGVPRYDSQGRFQGYIGSLIDITERKAAEAAMYDSEIRFRNLLEKIPLVSVQGYSADGTTNYWNQASEYLYGYTAKEALGRKLTDLIIPPEMREEVEKAMQHMFATGQPIPASEMQLMRKGGSRVDVFSSHAYVHVPGREPEMFCMDIDLTERKKDEERIRNLAFYDPLTQLPNRRLLLQQLQQALAESQRSTRHGAILFFDLDNFKSLNDTLGHDHGDLLLQQVAKRLKKCIREVDMVARLGGDEFVILLKELSENTQEAPFQTEIACLKILEALNRPYRLSSIEYHNTASIGIALFADNKVSAEELMKRADIAMYQAKQAGCNTFRFFDPDMQSAVEARVRLENGLRKALPANQFELYYQPQVDNDDRIHGAEVLLRWQHPEQGVISPSSFIPLAEETGLIVPIGLWVLENACIQLHRWSHHPGKKHLQLAVNVSARQFQQADFTRQILTILSNTGANPSRLKLELTESLVQDNIEETICKMRLLKQKGVQFSVDDFGTGYSSLSVLKKLPIDQLKIDRSFIRNIDSDSDDAAIVQTIIAMSGHLGLDVIAEGVETEQQKTFLALHDCRFFQGYLFGQPLPLEQFESLLETKLNARAMPRGS